MATLHGGTHAAAAQFGLDDYFRLARVVNLSLSDDGSLMLYVVEKTDLASDAAERTVYVSDARPGAVPRAIAAMRRSTDQAWIPHSSEIAYLAGRNGVTQLFALDPATGKVRALTDGTDPVSAFEFAPDGRSWAWVTERSRPGGGQSLYDRLHDGTHGIVIDSENTALYDFIDPDWMSPSDRAVTTLHLSRNGGAPTVVPVTGAVEALHWSPDSRRISVVYASDALPHTAFAGRFASVGSYDIGSGRFRTLLSGTVPSAANRGTEYAGGEWLPGPARLLVRRTIEDNSWKSHTDWAVIGAGDAGAGRATAPKWRPIETYASGSHAFTPVDDGLIYVDDRRRARERLFTLTPAGMAEAGFLRALPGSVSLVRFGADRKSAVFVQQTLASPPEIFRWDSGGGVRRITALNDAIKARIPFDYREISWRSDDGTPVSGWLMTPKSRGTSEPLPLVTFVHGGPGAAQLDAFMSYFKDEGGIWPYPFELYAASGIAVFIPNYRGTETFGEDFANPPNLDEAPVEDIVSGVRSLISSGVADPKRLGISGHSHGAWLGPLVMTRARMFAAGSFAEGATNGFIGYATMPGWLNREVHDVQDGGNPYDAPEKTLARSADFHMAGLDTAILFESGARSMAIDTMGTPKVAARAGMSEEFVVYPKVAHNIQAPHLQAESAQRNLDWFRFWLQGVESRDPATADQYRRWRAMRDARCARPGTPRPLYCG